MVWGLNRSGCDTMTYAWTFRRTNRRTKECRRVARALAASNRVSYEIRAYRDFRGNVAACSWRRRRGAMSVFSSGSGSLLLWTCNSVADAAPVEDAGGTRRVLAELGAELLNNKGAHALGAGGPTPRARRSSNSDATTRLASTEKMHRISYAVTVSITAAGRRRQTGTRVCHPACPGMPGACPAR